MKKTLIATLLALAGFALFADSYAFTYQTCLRDDKGEVIKEGGVVKKNLTVQIRLYKAATGGVALWGRAYNVLTDENGLFNLAVTDSAGSALDGVAASTLEEVFKDNPAGSIFLGITVAGSSGEIVPRQCIYATPFAAVANDVRAVSGDLAIGGNLTFGSGEEKLVLSKDGITQTGSNSTGVVFQKLSVTDSATVSGAFSAGGGVLKADGSGVKVQGRPLDVVGTQLLVDGAEVVPVPVGGIIMWTNEKLPDDAHWAICDGNNGTPDLSGRFIVGVGKSSNGDATYAVGNTGGSQSVKLTKDQMPSHRHYYAGDDQLEGIATAKDCTTSACKTDKPYDASSRLSGDSKVYETNSQGGDKAHENRPPYYALYYIMRIR